MSAGTSTPYSVGTDRPIPVILLTGFLGAGKTTLLNTVLRRPDMADTAVIVNEFGSISVDHDLVRRGVEQYLVTTTGCLCCTAGSDIRSSLFDLHEAARVGFAKSFSRVIVETTGLADPAPIIANLIPGAVAATGLRDHTVARRFRIAGVVTAFDAIFGERTLHDHLECWKQLAFADRVAITKADLLLDPASRRDLAETKERIAAINPGVDLRDVAEPGFDVGDLFAPRPYLTAERPEDVLGWLALERSGRAHDHAHDRNRHGDRIVAVPLEHDGPLDAGRFRAFLHLMTEIGGILRVKGLAAFADAPELPHVFHVVQHTLEVFEPLAGWPSSDRRSRLVVIGCDVDERAIRELFAATPHRRGSGLFNWRFGR